jgi:hypothetical protein
MSEARDMTSQQWADMWTRRAAQHREDAARFRAEKNTTAANEFLRLADEADGYARNARNSV